MSLVETTSAELAADDARELTDRIRFAVEATWQLIATAYTQRAWSALGYATWDDYCTREFGGSRLRLPREERGEVVASLREQGLSIRAIAAATGEGRGSIERALASVPDGTVEAQSADDEAKPITGLNGKRYAANRLRDAEPDSECVEEEAEAIVANLDDDEPETIDEAVDEAVESRRIPQPVPKPTVAEGVPPHPATYPVAVMDIFRELIPKGSVVLDPFAGVGTIHQLRPQCSTYGVEIEPEWAAAHPDTEQGDSRSIGDWWEWPVTVIATSPAYGNRLADSYQAADPESRRSYSIDLGHELAEGNGAGLHFGTDGAYERLHEEVWAAVVPLLRVGGLFLLNCKDFVRDGKVVPVTGWHIKTLVGLGMEVVDLRCLPAAGLPMTTAKPISELVVVMRKRVYKIGPGEVCDLCLNKVEYCVNCEGSAFGFDKFGGEIPGELLSFSTCPCCDADLLHGERCDCDEVAS